MTDLKENNTILLSYGAAVVFLVCCLSLRGPFFLLLRRAHQSALVIKGELEAGSKNLFTAFLIKEYNNVEQRV